MGHEKMQKNCKTFKNYSIANLQDSCFLNSLFFVFRGKVFLCGAV